MYRLGIDLGGTNIASGVVDENYKIVGEGKVKTNFPRPAEEIIDDIVKSALLAVEDAKITIDEIESIGIGTPGTVVYETGVVAYANNLGFYDLPLADILEEKLHKKVYIENDANAAAYGEYIAGCGKGADKFLAVTLGTGVGSGIIVDGKIYSGSNCAGGELGHMVIQMDGVPCTCGRNGCFEAYCSATALIRQTKQAMIKYNDSAMWDLCEGNIDNASGRTAFDAMRKGDKAGKIVVDEFIKFLSVGISNIVNIFQPDVLCIGGGISNEGETLLAPLREIVLHENYGRNMEKKTEIKAATLANDAGIIGAAYLGDIANN